MKSQKLLVALLSVAALSGCGKDNKEIPTLNYLYNTSEAHKAIGEYVQSAFKLVGAEMTLNNQEWNTFLNTRKNGDYAVARNGWLGDYNDPISFLDMWTSGSGNNDVQYGKGAHANLKMYNLDLTGYGYTENVTNGTWEQTYDVLISKIKTCTDTTKRYQLMHLAEDMLMDTGCITPLYYYTDIYMVDDTVTGFYSNPLGYKYFKDTKVNGSSAKINVCIASEPDTLDPAANSSVDGATLAAHLFSGLAKWSKNATTGALEIVPDCAKALVAPVENIDGTVTYTYELKENLKWSNGDAMVASDFANSWKRASKDDYDYGYMFEVVKGYDGKGALDVVADDTAGTITVTLNNAVSYWNELLAFPSYYPIHSSNLTSKTWQTSVSTYINNGAYTLDSWDHNSKIVLKKNANYFDKANITMEEIDFYLSDDSNNMLTNFKNGDWQMIDDVPTAEIANLKKDYASEFFVGSQLGTYYICWNINFNLLPKSSKLAGVEKELAQQEIRKAFSLLLDRNYICEEIGQAGQEPASSFVALGLTDSDGTTQFYKNAGDSAKNGYVGYYDVSKTSYESNCAAAIEILKKYYEIKD